MSAGVSDQRMKAQGNQVPNGPKDGLSEHEDYSSWRNPHQNYGTQMSSSMPASDPYMAANYYETPGYPYPFSVGGVSDGTWSNGSEHMAAFLGGYSGQVGGHSSYNFDGMLGGGGFSGFGQPGYNYFPGNGDYSGWGNSNMNRKQYEDYFREYSDDRGMKDVHQGIQGLNISDGKPAGRDAVKVDGGAVKEMPMVSSGAGMNAQPKKTTWASIASQPAKPQPQLKKKGVGSAPPPMFPGKHGMDIGTWDSKNGTPGKAVSTPPAPHTSWVPPRGRGQPPQNYAPNKTSTSPQAVAQPPTQPPSHPVLDDLRCRNTYNPNECDVNLKGARFFVIKSYSEDDIHRSIKYEIWCSTEHGNKRLDSAYRERENKGSILLFFSVNGSGHFCGMAQMMSSVNYSESSSVWAQDKWKGQFGVKWIYVKDVPNSQLRHIRLENNENKPVTNSRDTQEVPFEKGKQVLKIIHSYKHTTSIFDDFIHYEKRQEEEESRRVPPQALPGLPKEEGRGRGRGSNRGARN